MALSDLTYLDFTPFYSSGSEATPALSVSEVAAKNAIRVAIALEDAIATMNNAADQLRDYEFTWTEAELPDEFTNVFYTSPSITEPSIAGVDAPSDISVPAINTPTLPTIPTYTDRTGIFEWEEPMWQSELLTEVQRKLLYDLINGGYGIEPTDEAALWQREREREQVNGEAAILEASRQAAARGFSLPPGVLAKQIQAAQMAAMEKNSSVSRDIGLKRADMYVQNRQFTIQEAREVERVIIEYMNSYFNRQLEAARAKLDMYRLSLEAFQSELQAYTAQVGALETGVRMQALVVEQNVKVYAAKLSKYEADLRASIDRAQVKLETYRLQVADASAASDARAKTVAAKTGQSEARARVAITNAQVRIEALKAKMGTLQSAAELYIAPANALAGLSEAYVASNQAITADIK